MQRHSQLCVALLVAALAVPFITSAQSLRGATFVTVANAVRQKAAATAGLPAPTPLAVPAISSSTPSATSASTSTTTNISSSGLPYVKLPAASPPFASLPPAETYKSNFTLTNPKGTELSSSLVFVNMDELKQYCKPMAQKAATFNGKKIMIVPTVHWSGNDVVVNRWCYRFGSGCDNVTETSIQQFAADVQACIQATIDAGFTEVHVLPHNDIKDGYVWRNSLDFAPFAKYGGYTYYDVLISPVVDALKVAMATNPGIKVYLTLQGETGMSVFKYTTDWIKAVAQARAQLTDQTIAEAAAANYNSKAKVGISLNYDKICMCLDFAPTIGGLEYATRYPGEWNKAYKTLGLDFAAIKQLYQTIDFVGISDYTALPPSAPVSDMELGLIYHDVELSLMGVSLADIVTKKGLELVISEWGFGGGYIDGVSISPNASYLVDHPFFGLWGAYSKSIDPWSNQEYQNIRLETFRKAAIWLKQQGGPTYRVSSLFNWNAGSWDVQGIRYDSTEWGNKEVGAVIAAHNKAVNT